MNRIDRLFAILLLMQLKRRRTAREIAAQFGISERTVYRDMQALSEMGIPLTAQAGEGYELLDSFSMPPIALNEGETRAAVMAIQWFIRNSTGDLQTNARAGLHKIEAVLPPALQEAVRALARLIDYYPAATPVDWEQPELQQIVDAIRSCRVLRIAYQGFQAAGATRRDIEPLRLTLSQGAWYVEAFCRLRGDLRSFRMTRIESITTLDETFTPRTVIPARPRQIEVAIRFAPPVQPRVRERQHYAFIHEDDEMMVYRVQQLSEIANWVLGFGADAEVLRPPELRQWIRDEAQRLIRLMT